MDGNDLRRCIAPLSAGKATREILAALHRRQNAAAGGTAAECRKLGLIGAFAPREGVAALGPKLEAARRV